MDPYEKLANAIIIQAAKDYRTALRKLRRNPRNHLAQAEAESIDRFFRSGWYKCLTDVDGEMVIRKLREEDYRLDHRINSDLAELERLRDMEGSISSPSFEEHYNPNRNTEAPFIRCLEKVWDLEMKIKTEIDKLISLKDQMREVIDAVQNTDEQMVLRYRYIHNMTWEQIGDELKADESTVRRWHRRALASVIVPADPIVI